jgi:hypothetical protein
MNALAMSKTNHIRPPSQSAIAQLIDYLGICDFCDAEPINKVIIRRLIIILIVSRLTPDAHSILLAVIARPKSP